MGAQLTLWLFKSGLGRACFGARACHIFESHFLFADRFLILKVNLIPKHELYCRFIEKEKFVGQIEL